MWKTGWGYLDGIHEKLLLVDSSLGMTTGRGHADQYLQWMDTAFFYKGGLVSQSREAFQALWNTVKRNRGRQSQHEAYGSEPSRFVGFACGVYSQ